MARRDIARGIGACAVAALALALLGAEVSAQASPTSPREPLPRSEPLARDTLRKPLPVDALPSGAVKLKAETPTAPPARPALDRDTVQVPLALEGRTAEQQKSDSIKLAAGVGRITNTAAGAPVLELPARGSVILSSDPGRASAAQSRIQEGVKTPLPWLVVETRGQDGAVDVLTARPFLTLARAIAWNAQLGRHVAEFLFGLDPESGAPGPLENEVLVRFSVTCDEVEPALARIGKVGPDGYGVVRVACSPKVKNERKDHHIQVHAGHGNLRYPFELPHRPGGLSLTPSATRVHGFGFGSLVFTVQRVEEDGTPLAAESDVPVQLVVDGGSIDASALTIPAGKHSASLEVHPHGLGRIAVSAVGGALRSEQVAVELTWPLAQVLAMIGGGLLGGVVSAIGPRKRKLARRAAEGALVGLLVTAVVLLVPSFAALPVWARSTELGLFAIAALAGFAGTPLLDRLAQTVFPKLGGAPAN